MNGVGGRYGLYHGSPPLLLPDPAIALTFPLPGSVVKLPPPLFFFALVVGALVSPPARFLALAMAIPPSPGARRFTPLKRKVRLVTVL
eukprot:1188820-Prorocentrum_minimum.AAC.6